MCEFARIIRIFATRDRTDNNAQTNNFSIHNQNEKWKKNKQINIGWTNCVRQPQTPRAQCEMLFDIAASFTLNTNERWQREKNTLSYSFIYYSLCVFVSKCAHVLFIYNIRKRNIQHTQRRDTHTAPIFFWFWLLLCVEVDVEWSESSEREMLYVHGGVSDMCFPFRIRDVLGGGWFG